jgi:hypothetical protein
MSFRGVIRATIVISSWIAIVSGAAFAQVGAPGRPWDVKERLALEFKDRLKAAGNDAAKRKEVASWCLEQGMPHLVPRAFESVPLSAETAPLLGFVPDSNPPALVDAARFSPAARPLPTLRSLDPKRKKELLAAKDRSLRLANQSTYFDLTSDLDAEVLDVHSKMLNDYYRTMKNRFRAYPETNVDVVVYANRADYLLDYAFSTKKSGENVLGYFVPAWRALFFYDDPYDRDEVALIARHECTHLLFHVAYGGRPIPDWLNEGMACYLAGDGENARGGYTMRLVLELAAQASQKSFDLKPVFSVKHANLKYEHYAQSWAMVYFLNSGSRGEKFQKFLLALRDGLDPEAKESQVIELVREQLEESFGESVESLAAGCARFVAETMAFQRPDQLLEIGLSAIVRLRFEKPGLPPEQWIETAAASLRSAMPSLAGGDLARARFGSLELKLARADLDKPTVDGWRLVLRSIVDELRTTPALVDEGQVGAFARAIVARVSEVLDAKAPKGKPRDLVAELKTRAEKLNGIEAERAKAFAVLVEDLLEIAYGRLAAALDADPLHRRAAMQWVLLSMEAAPHKLLEIHPLLKLLVERDASDDALATLGVAYIGLGNVVYGKALLKRASEFTVQPASISELMAWQK